MSKAEVYGNVLARLKRVDKLLKSKGQRERERQERYGGYGKTFAPQPGVAWEGGSPALPSRRADGTAGGRGVVGGEQSHSAPPAAPTPAL